MGLRSKLQDYATMERKIGRTPGTKATESALTRNSNAIALALSRAVWELNNQNKILHEKLNDATESSLDVREDALEPQTT